ncbi:hypothetical protein CFter6_3677 [Collimonas fungivorans]|uniref:Uncharacterized protein n=1 Tax=Collimonas fungivorans TaxID=158899 RepID=A0A127PER1_9BURK|nr:hypothetical protein CFter6_3677 [Collimonas fungivorans]
MVGFGEILRDFWQLYPALEIRAGQTHAKSAWRESIALPARPAFTST